MTLQTIINNSKNGSELSKFDTTRKTTNFQRARLSAIAFCCLAMGVAALPGYAEIITGGSVLDAATGTVAVTTPNIGWDWAGLPQNNPDQITVNSTSNAYGEFRIYLNFAVAPSTEYGITWNMTNASGFDWYSMHFTWSYSPQGDLALAFDQSGAFPSSPGNTVGYNLDNWTDPNIDFSGGVINGVNGTATFYLPFDVLGRFHSGTVSVFATPDYSPQTPEPSGILLVGSGILGIGGLLRRRLML